MRQDFEEFSQIRLNGLYNLKPGELIPVVRTNAAGERVLGLVKWGLIPFWTKGKPKEAPVNARADKLATSGMFRQAFDRRRCLIPVDGFYEPKGPKPKRGEPTREQYFFSRPDDGLFALGGIWERWSPDPQSLPIDTVTIITTEPNASVAPIHDRAPLILDEAEQDRWLDRNRAGTDVADLVRPYAGELSARHVDKALVNSRTMDGPELIEPIE